MVHSPPNEHLVEFDQTLIDDDLLKLGSHLISHFDPERVKGASYDIRVGSKIEFPGRAHPICLGYQQEIAIEPGAACVVESFEEVFVPPNMKGRIFLRTYHAQRLIIYVGGLIDPGFSGHLRFPIANLSDAVVYLRQGDPLVAVEFVRLRQTALPYDARKKDGEPRTGDVIAFDRARLSTTVQENSSKIQALQNSLDKALADIRREIESHGDTIRSNQKILDLVMLAAVAAGAGAAAVTGITAVQGVSGGVMLPVAGGLLVAFLIYLLCKRSGR